MDDTSFLVEFLAGIMIFIGFGFWFAIDSYSISKYEGKIKRGIKIWGRELPYETQQFLLNLKADVVESKKVMFSEFKSAFIRVRDDEVVVFSTPRRYHSSWPYVGYVDLTSPNFELEYRGSLPGIIFLIPFTILGLIIFVVNFIIQTRAIDSFLENKTKEYFTVKEKII